MGANILLGLIVICGALWSRVEALDEQEFESTFQKAQAETKGPSFTPQCGQVVYNYRFDCSPMRNVTQESCEARGCCWDNSSQINYKKASVDDIGVPFCYFPTNYPDYKVASYNQTIHGYKLVIRRDVATGWPNESKELHVNVSYVSNQNQRAYARSQIMRIKIWDPLKHNFEVPMNEYKNSNRSEPSYQVEFGSSPFTMSADYDMFTVFDTNIQGAPLIFSDQFIQFSTRLPNPLLYGLGEHKDNLLFNASNGFQQRGFWARDNGPEFNTNLYGVHNFFMQTMTKSQMGEDFQLTYGMFVANSNAQEMIFQPMPAMTYRTLGGILDIYIISGQTPQEVVELYTYVIGRPFMPPYWSLGFHLCRYGYQNSTRLKQIIQRNRALNIPYEAQWTDIDYMKSHLDWTYDNKTFVGLPSIVQDLHDHGQRYIIIVDPAIATQANNYSPYTEGINDKVFIMNSTHQPEIGVVWPGSTAFPDFTNPAAVDWWYNFADKFHQTLPFDGLWTDMNEPSNFVSGSKYGCTNSSLDNPPYVPNSIKDQELSSHTLCPSAQQYLSSHYNLHSMYGHFEMKATMEALIKIRKKRSVVISRSTFMGSGLHGGHWSGDITSTWEDLRYSIPDILDFNIFGIPMVGADICGFGGDTTYELCIRWMQLGSFYPFMRNHNSLNQKDQDPGEFNSTATDIMRKALELRYTFLPYLYTLMYQSHQRGYTVATPLLFACPTDPATIPIQEQFFWGDGLLVSPVLYEGATEVAAYFCGDNDYYDLIDGSTLVTGKQWVNLSAPLDTIRLHQREGTVIPIQKPAVTTTLSRKNPFDLLVALPCESCRNLKLKKMCIANGILYWDDGDTLDETASNLIVFNATQESLKISQGSLGYKETMQLSTVVIFGVPYVPNTVHLSNGTKDVPVHFDSQKLTTNCYRLTLSQFTLDLKEYATFYWS